MKKIRVLLAIMLVAMMVLGTACNKSDPAPSNTDAGDGDAAPVVIETLRIAYVPTFDAELILTTTEPLKQMLIDELAKHNFDVKEVEITVGTSQEAVGEALSAGSVDVGFGGASLYVTYDDEVDLLLTATRYGLSVKGQDPRDWNTGVATENTTEEVIGYPGHIYVGPSPKGQELAAKVEAGEELTWEDLASATWATGNTTSNAGYIYPSLWLKNNYGKTMGDLPTVINGTNYPSMFAQAASEQIDIFMSYADARTAYVETWNTEMGREESIWDEVKVIAVTEYIVNDVAAGSKTSDTMTTPGFADAFRQAMIEIAKTDAGKEAISVYSHIGYVVGDDANYDVLREVQEMIKNQ